jgi:copper homeostasis protein
MSKNFLVEICVDSVESAIAAQEGGADRVELCANLNDGGTTPSAGLIVAARRHLRLGLHVLIRPRGGDFCYSAVEFESMKSDVVFAKNLGADGVVFGILKPDHTVDVERMRALVVLARPMSVTFHRAFDVANEPFRALEDIIALGADRLLTSGQAQTAKAGLPVIAQLAQKAAGRLRIMPGGGINAQDLPHFINTAGVSEIHAGSAVTTKKYSAAGLFTAWRGVVDPQKVGAFINWQDR